VLLAEKSAALTALFAAPCVAKLATLSKGCRHRSGACDVGGIAPCLQAPSAGACRVFEQGAGLAPQLQNQRAESFVMNLMNLIDRLTLAQRLLLATTAMLVMASLVVVIGITRLSVLADDLHLIGSDQVPKVQRVTSVVENLNTIARELRNGLIYEDPAQVDAAFSEVLAARSSIGKTLDELTPTMVLPEDKRRLAAVQSARAAYVPMQNQFMDLVRAGKKPEAASLLSSTMRPLQMVYLKALGELRDLQIEQVQQAAQRGEQAYGQAKLLMWGLLAVMACAGLVGSVIMVRSITKRINLAVSVAERVAAGDLRNNVHHTHSDEIGRLLQALQRMNTSLSGIVSSVRSSSDSIATGSAQIASGNADLSQRTEEQASALQQTTASMEQLGSTVTGNAANAKTAQQLAQEASTVAAKGGEVVGAVVQTMQGINSSSREISAIVSVIDGIAFQTNILALNAAVEAARAGEQGRGFAVVATEVRTLAQRSAAAAKEIKHLIDASVQRVDEGSRLVDQAGATMAEVVQAIGRVNQMVSDISDASTAQSAGVAQVSTAMTQMDHSTQQNAAMVEEANAAAASLKAQAQQLVAAVAVFKLDPQTR
jgi:methyl-accepting chemotaxis protein